MVSEDESGQRLWRWSWYCAGGAPFACMWRWLETMGLEPAGMWHASPFVT